MKEENPDASNKIKRLTFKSKNPKRKKNHNELVVYIYNVVEDEWSFISTISDKEERRDEVESCNSSAECYLFANADENEFTYISPKPITSEFKRYFQQLVGATKIEIIVPKNDSHLICKDFYNDKPLFNRFLKKAKKYKKVTLVSYATSPQFLDLVERLKEKKINVIAPEAPEVDCAWTVNFFGSKSGIRQLAQQSAALEPDFIMPEGVICMGKLDAAKIAANRYINDNGVVVKTNKGSSGNGVLIFRSGDLPKVYKECEKTIYSILNKNDYWDRYPIIIEDLINVDVNAGSSFPSIEFKIHKNGKIELLYYCLMSVTKEGAFCGIDMHEDVINERLAARIIDTGYFIAERYAAAGYRGHFDIDMITTKYNQVFVNESNTRNTGGTDVFKVALELIGKDFFSDSYVLSRTRFKIPHISRPTFSKVLKILEPILYDKKTKEGVMVISENIIKQGQIIYNIFGNTKKRAYQIDTEMKRLLQNGHE